MDTTTRLHCPAGHDQACHLAAGHEIVALRGALAVTWLDTSLEWLPQATHGVSRTLREGESLRMPCAALVRLRGVEAAAEALLVAPAPGGLRRLWVSLGSLATQGARLARRSWRGLHGARRAAPAPRR